MRACVDYTILKHQMTAGVVLFFPPCHYERTRGCILAFMHNVSTTSLGQIRAGSTTTTATEYVNSEPAVPDSKAPLRSV
jgi:hypothetical protein